MQYIIMIGGDYINDHAWSVYLHTNKVNSKKYVGITSQPVESRWMNGYGYGKHLRFGRAIDKYGWDNFLHEVLYTGLSESEAKQIERSLIYELQTQNEAFGYNMTAGGEGLSGFNHRDESRYMMSQSKKGVNHPNYGRHLPDLTRERISMGLKNNSNALGCVRSDETKRKMSDSKKKPVCMYLDNVFCGMFDSAKDAEQLTGISRKNISLCCLGQRKRAGGYEWNFA